MVKRLKIKENVSDAVDSLPYLKYKITRKGVTITKCDKSVTNIVIPSKIEGYPVTKIGNNCFLDCVNLKFVKIPTSVTSIGDSAFKYCSKLTSITIPNSVTSIGDYAFKNCSGLTSITISNSVTKIGDLAFRHCDKLQEITVSEKLFNKYSDVFNTPDLFDCEFILT